MLHEFLLMMYENLVARVLCSLWPNVDSGCDAGHIRTIKFSNEFCFGKILSGPFWNKPPLATAQNVPYRQNLGLVRINRCGLVPLFLHLRRTCRHCHGTVVLHASKHPTKSILQLSCCKRSRHSCERAARLQFFVAMRMCVYQKLYLRSPQN